MNLAGGGSSSGKLGAAKPTPHGLCPFLSLEMGGRLLGLDWLTSGFNLLFTFYLKVLMVVSSRNRLFSGTCLSQPK